MKDYISINSETEGKEQGFLCMFDGHGGKEVAKFTSENLWKAIHVLKVFKLKNNYKFQDLIIYILEKLMLKRIKHNNTKKFEI